MNVVLFCVYGGLCAMEFQTPMDLDAKIALLDAYRCGTLNVKESQFVLTNPLNGAEIKKDFHSVAAYFKELLSQTDQDCRLEISKDMPITDYLKALKSDRTKEIISRKLFVDELKYGCNSEGIFYKEQLGYALDNKNFEFINSILKQLKEMRASDFAKPIETITNPDDEKSPLWFSFVK